VDFLEQGRSFIAAGSTCAVRRLHHLDSGQLAALLNDFDIEIPADCTPTLTPAPLRPVVETKLVGVHDRHAIRVDCLATGLLPLVSLIDGKIA